MQENRRRVNTFLDKDLVMQAKMLALRHEIPLNELIEEALRRLIDAPNLSIKGKQVPK